MSTAKEILIKAREILTPGRWVQGQWCTIKNGAECYCLVGALKEAAGIYSTDVGLPIAWDAFADAEQALERVPEIAAHPHTPHDRLVVIWNDAPGRTRAEVIAALDTAIAAQEAA
jgi:hypothetical protein